MYPQLVLTALCLAGPALAQLKISMSMSSTRARDRPQAKAFTVPLGDSITEITCWRSKLWDHLADANVTSNIDFVGSMTDNTQNCTAAHSDWDHHHEGHSGYLAIDIANNYLTGWLASAKPDIVMFMLGTNDVFQSHSTADIIAAYTKMVQEMRSSNPNTKIIVSAASK